MGVNGGVVPHCVFFRGAAEGRIRQKLIQDNLLGAVIGLPANLFFGTGIPAAILFFSQGKKHHDVLFIDASHEFADAKNQNLLADAHLNKIVATYRATTQEIASLETELATVRKNWTATQGTGRLITMPEANHFTT